MIKQLPIQEIFKELEETFKDIVYITDSNVYKYYSNYFNDDKTIVVKAGEKSKSIETINAIYSELLEMNANRNTVIIGVGGGIVTDITGFVASTYMRGVKFGFISTSLLGMVDASIGGKNGINFNGYKNIIGTISQPLFIYWSIDFLDTLPQEEIENGFGEIVKYAIGFENHLFDLLYSYNIINDKHKLLEVIKICQHIKQDIVYLDEKEHNIRKKLNLGHTIAHAIEKFTNNSISHGKAVLIGLYYILKFSWYNEYINKQTYELILSLLEKYKFDIDFEIINKMNLDIQHDKKSVDSKNIDLVIITNIGNCEVIKINKTKII